MLDRVTTVDLVARAIDRVFSSDGRVRGRTIYLPEDLLRIGEAMARRAGDPERFTCQGFHTTSVIQSKMRQLLETDPVPVIEPIAELAVTGSCTLEALDGSSSIKVECDLESLALDLEARLCDEQSIMRKGFRDAAGQLYDLIVMQALLNKRAEGKAYTLAYRQRPSAGIQTTGEVVVKGFRELAGREDTVAEGTSLSIEDAVSVCKITEGNADGLIVDASLSQSAELKPIQSPVELVERARAYREFTKRPVQIPVYINRLLSPEASGNGHDLHMITALYDKNSELFFCQSHWGLLADSRLNGIEPQDLYQAMVFQSRTDGIAEPYDEVPPDKRAIDTVFPVKPRDWSVKLMDLKKEAAWLNEQEQRAMSTSFGQARHQYREDYCAWQDARIQHLEMFGEAIPFDKPEPKRPG